MVDTMHGRAASAIPEEITGFFDGVKDALSVRKVVGDPIERDGVTLVPVAAVRGGGGGGGGEGGPEQQQGVGAGLGFGLAARPVGSYVIKDGDVKWIPAVDPARIAAVVVAVAFFVSKIARSISRRRS
jgi:uncharacterized spore protein YtfJ